MRVEGFFSSRQNFIWIRYFLVEGDSIARFP